MAAAAARHRARRGSKIQERYDVKYLNYRVDAEAGKLFCLVEAPNADAAHAVHREAMGYRRSSAHCLRTSVSGNGIERGPANKGQCS